MSEPKIDSEQYLSARDMQYHRDVYEKILLKDELDECHLSNFLWNFPILKNYPGILGFEGIFKGMPAIIVGAGPSLEKNGEILKEIRKNVILISVDAALPVLVKKYKLYPDFVIMGDPTDKQKFNFDDIDTKKFYTIASTVTHPSIFRTIDPHHLAVYNFKSGSKLLDMIPYHIGRKGALPAGVLTSGSAFTFAGMCGCDPITFIGHDLSWPTPEKVYADGVVEKKHSFQKSVKFKGDCLLFPDINGNLVLTHSTFINFYIWLRDSIQRIKPKIFNSSEAGILKMKKIKPMPLRQWADRYCTREITGLAEKIEKAYYYAHSDGNVEKILLPPMQIAQRARV